MLLVRWFHRSTQEAEGGGGGGGGGGSSLGLKYIEQKYLHGSPIWVRCISCFSMCFSISIPM